MAKKPCIQTWAIQPKFNYLATKKPQSKEDSQCAVEAAEVRGQGTILGNLPLPLCFFGKVFPCLLLQFLVWDLADVTDGFPCQ